MWSDEELAAYVAEAGRGFRSSSPAVPQGQQTTVLGSTVSVDEPARAPQRAAWLSFSKSQPQLRQRSATLGARVRLLDAVVMPCCMWGLESVDLCAEKRRQLDATQRSMIGRMLHVFKRPAETIIASPPMSLRNMPEANGGSCRGTASFAWQDRLRS